MTPKFLANLQCGNIGVALGKVSGGLCAIDLDDYSLIEPFLAANPQLRDTLQTHGARGRVFWIRFGDSYPRKSRKLKLTSTGREIGEIRSNGNQSIVWGIHPDTKRPYKILVNKPAISMNFDSLRWPDGIINPFKQRNWTEVTEETDVTDEAKEAKVILSPGLPLFSLINSVADAVQKCLPTQIHENNLRLFDLARALLTLNQNKIPHDPDEVFELWYDKAKAFLRQGLSRDDYYLEFLKACHRAKVPLGSQIVSAAWERAKQNLMPLPPKVLAINRPGFGLLCAFFREMQVGAGSGKEWFVAGGQRACAQLLGHKSHSTVETWIGALQQMKVLETVKKGDAFHSTRFIYLPTLR